MHDVHQDALFSQSRLPEEDYTRDPLIVMGLPRSGSSFLSHILSQIPDWYVFDDLYLQREALKIGASTRLTENDLKRLLHFLGWQIRARLKHGIYAIPNVGIDEVPRMDEAVKQAFLEKPGSWTELQEEWMLRLAHRAGCRRWGYKLPGAFRFIPMLRERYPDAKVMFIMRNPYKVLASYKHMPKTSQDGNPWRYHPVAYAVYWRLAARSYFRHRDAWGDAMMLVQFEDLVKAPQQTAEEIADFLDAETPEQVSVPEKPNSSFSQAKAGGGLTGLETWIVNKIAGQAMRDMGYSIETVPIKVADFTSLFVTSMRFCAFQTGQFMTRLKSRVRKK